VLCVSCVVAFWRLLSVRHQSSVSSQRTFHGRSLLFSVCPNTRGSDIDIDIDIDIGDRRSEQTGTKA
jgi:hypothetical protein